MKEKELKYLPMRGIIVPANWDHEGEIVDLALLTDDEGEFLVERGDVIWDELLNSLREEIDVTSFHLSNKYAKSTIAKATVAKQNIDKQTIAIKAFEKVKNRKINTMSFF